MVGRWPLVRCALVSWLNRGTNKRSHYTWCINKSRQPIIRFDLRPQPARLLLQAGASGRALEPYLRAAEYIIPKISVRTIREKASNNTDGGPSERAANILAAAIASFDLRLDVTRGRGREFADDFFQTKFFYQKSIRIRLVIIHDFNTRHFSFFSYNDLRFITSRRGDIETRLQFTARESGYLIGGNSGREVEERSWNFEVTGNRFNRGNTITPFGARIGPVKIRLRVSLTLCNWELRISFVKV